MLSTLFHYTFILVLFLAFLDIMFAFISFVSFPGFVLLALESENPFSCICLLNAFTSWSGIRLPFLPVTLSAPGSRKLGVVVMYRNALVCSSFLSSVYFVSWMCLGPLESGRVRVGLS